jgi:hypothetical protein
MPRQLTYSRTIKESDYKERFCQSLGNSQLQENLPLQSPPLAFPRQNLKKNTTQKHLCYYKENQEG